MGEFYWSGIPTARSRRSSGSRRHTCIPKRTTLNHCRGSRNAETTQRCASLKLSSARPSKTPIRSRPDELSKHVEYEDGSPEAFLRRLWRDLYGDEPVGT
jgi:hypothetical protein